MTVSELLKWIIGICLSLAVLWWIALKMHTTNIKNFYGRIAMNMDKSAKGENIEGWTKKQRLLKLFFYRQITYEFSAYVLLVICIGFLIACIYIFLTAGSNVPLHINGQRLNVTEYLISVLSIRLGIALVIFFICQVLLKLYRYCLGFTSFYTGLFDALFIHDELDKDVEEAIALFTYKNTLEEAPNAPTEKVLEILKSLK